MTPCALWFISLLGFMVHKEKTEALANNIPGFLVHKYSLANFWAALVPGFLANSDGVPGCQDLCSKPVFRVPGFRWLQGSIVL